MTGIMFRSEMLTALRRSLLWSTDGWVERPWADDSLKTVTRRVGPSWTRVKPGAVLYVKETTLTRDGAFLYAHDGAVLGPRERWTPSMMMPRAAARTWLRVLSNDLVPFDRLTQAETLAEGFATSGDFEAFFAQLHKGPRPELVYRIHFEKVNPQ